MLLRLGIVYVVTFVIGIAVGYFGSGGRIGNRLSKENREYRAAVDRYVNVEGALFHHMREHVVRDKDLTWADGLPPFVTVGIKEDGSLMSDDEWRQAKKMAGLDV